VLITLTQPQTQTPSIGLKVEIKERREALLLHPTAVTIRLELTSPAQPQVVTQFSKLSKINRTARLHAKIEQRLKAGLKHLLNRERNLTQIQVLVRRVILHNNNPPITVCAHSGKVRVNTSNQFNKRA
jgi:hypothetical protein